MLIYENRSLKNSKEEGDKSRMLLSVVVCKILIRFPIDVFMSEFKKVLGRICKLLRRKEVEVRESSRKCLGEIARLVGPELVYLIFSEMKYHLK
jgi:hypothetical protein